MFPALYYQSRSVLSRYGGVTTTEQAGVVGMWIRPFLVAFCPQRFGGQQQQLRSGRDGCDSPMTVLLLQSNQREKTDGGEKTDEGHKGEKVPSSELFHSVFCHIIEEALFRSKHFM